MPLNLPSSYPGNPSGYVTYYKAQADNYSMSAVYARNPLETTTVLDWEMSTMLAQCSRSIATKVYVADTGAWSTAANWFPTGVPVAGDNVLIGEGVSVTYDIDAPTTSLSYVRLDGTLAHPNNASTAMNVNTIFITPTGKHQIASESAPLSASRTCRIIFSSSTDMDPTVDTALQTKGIVSAGTRQYFGAPKTHFLKVTSNAGPAAAATQIILEAQPTGWQVGDRITINGTRYGGYSDRVYSLLGVEEETRTITGIGLSGTVSLNTALTYGHTAPSSTLVATNTMRAYVANLTRNIKFLTENGTTCARHRRAHDMQMHYPTYRAQWVEWRDMGRTDKRFYHGGLIAAPSGAFYNILANNNTLNGSLAVNNTVSLATEAQIWFSGRSEVSQNMVIEGFARSGTAISSVRGISGEQEYLTPERFTRVTRMYPTLGGFRAEGGVGANTTGRLITSSGIRNTNGNRTNSAVWTYETPYREANIQGRYPVHFHKCGTSIDVFTSPISMLGCVVSATPGWGFVHHISHANFVQCIAHDFGGAGFSAEAGNETGLWKDCLAVKCDTGRPTGSFKLDNEDSGNVDPGRGAAFWFTGRMVKVVGCVAADALVGYWYNVRVEMTKLTGDQFDQPSSLLGLYDPTIDEAPIIHFKDNEAIACSAGFFLTKAQQFQKHDVRTVLGPHLSWSCVTGFFVEYTQHYTYPNLTLVQGFLKSPQGTGDGLEFGPNLSDQVVVSLKADGFNRGVYDNHTNANDSTINSVTANSRVYVSPQFSNCSISFGGAIAATDVFMSSVSLTTTISLSISMTTDGTRRWITYQSQLPLRDDAADAAARNGWRISGEKRDKLYGQVPADLNFYPGGISAGRQRDYPIMEGQTNQVNFARAYGVFNDSVLGLMMYLPAFYSDRTTGDLSLKMVPARPSPTYTATLNAFVRGSADLSKYGATDGLPAPLNLRTSLGQNTTTNLNLLAGATHSLSISMYVAGIARPYNCHIVDNLNGTITIVPPVGFTGTETFSYWVADNNANVTQRSVIVEVNQLTGTGRAGVNDFIATQNNTAVSVNVLANDIGDTKVLQTATVVGGPGVGTASISTGGIIVFTPTSTYATVTTQTAEVQYTFTASGGSAGASLYITVNPPATGRSGVSDFNSTTYNVAVSTNVLANDVGDLKVLQTAVVVGGAAVGTASISTGGIIVFTPTSTFARTITQVAEIQYTFTASGGSAGASLFVTVNAGPPLPVAVADFTSTTYNLAVSYNVLANDTGGTVKTLLTATVVNGNSVGTASISTGGVIVFTPSSTFATTLTQVAEIQYTFTTTGGSAAGSLFVTVNAGPSQPASLTFTSPIATDGTAQAFVGQSNGILVLRQAYDTNVNGYILVNSAQRIDGVAGTVDFDPSGIVYVTPNEIGTMRVSYRVVNAGNLTAVATMTIYAATAPRVGGGDAGSGPMIGAPVSWNRKSVSNIKSVAKAISSIFADLDPNDPIRLAERMVRKYTFPEIRAIMDTSDFESLLDMELQELVEEMERLKNGG
jgi:hypothetical protein